MRTANLDLLLLQYNQAQKEIVANEWFVLFDAMFSRNIVDICRDVPEHPKEGEVYIVAQDAVGAWQGKRNHLAFYYNGWRYLVPKIGFSFCLMSSASEVKYNGQSWEVMLKDKLCVLESSADVMSIDLSISQNYHLKILNNVQIIFCEVEKKYIEEIRMFISVSEQKDILWDPRISWPRSLFGQVQTEVCGDVFISMFYIGASNQFYVRNYEMYSSKLREI